MHAFQVQIPWHSDCELPSDYEHEQIIRPFVSSCEVSGFDLSFLHCWCHSTGFEGHLSSVVCHPGDEALQFRLLLV